MLNDTKQLKGLNNRWVRYMRLCAIGLMVCSGFPEKLCAESVSGPSNVGNVFFTGIDTGNYWRIGHMFGIMMAQNHLLWGDWGLKGSVCPNDDRVGFDCGIGYRLRLSGQTRIGHYVHWNTDWGADLVVRKIGVLGVEIITSRWHVNWNGHRSFHSHLNKQRLGANLVTSFAFSDKITGFMGGVLSRGGHVE